VSRTLATLEVPALSFDHLLRMSDDVGLLEHARGATPRRAHGYCTDDVSRGLVVLGREPDPSADQRWLTERYLGFVMHAQGDTGAFRNRLGYDRRWQDPPGTGDWWGRALWGLGTVAARSAVPWVREAALACFDRGATQRSPWPRAMAFAALGAAEILDRYPDHPRARMLLKASTALVARPVADAPWPWPEPRLTYANAVLPEMLIVAGRYGDDDSLVDDGLRLLEWLLRRETRDGHLSVVPVGGWRSPEPRPAFDQQPIEVSALVDACARALAVTRDGYWATGIRMGVGWFLGDNDLGVPMADAGTGGGFDGLGAESASINQGAESTLALLATLQYGRTLGMGGDG
jgi:hypothetical protein